MKRKKLEIDEIILMSNEDQNQIRGGVYSRTRTRTRLEDGTRIKTVQINQ